ncbi:RidA family protein [Salipiger sp. 1_MG-2023]|uniref:RidA family protein n=1 Tax=Salipiger sp. 1_MG-2023 TaxID=3062665 RepID=UPI0026E2A244|nr:RidA family protein [Salipiger sp. 1_MG-2023]MDO6587211.1 RidA family protein [Salipiger sp. 1_MG-2023]
MSDIPLSKVRRVGNTVYLSGELGFDETGGMPEGIEAQTHNCLSRIRETLKGEGLALTDVVSATCHLTDKADFAAFNAVYASYFPEPRPVRTTVIAELVIEAKLEITVIAVI